MRGLADILRLEDLSEANWERIFQSYFKTKNVKILDIGGQTKLDGINEQYNSDIKKISLKLSVNGEDKEVHTFIKVPMDSILHDTNGKLVMTFAKEIFWYKEGSVILGSKYPELKGISPTLFHGASTFQDDFVSPGCCRKHCCFFAWCLCTKKEQGIMIMEDLTKLPQPYQMHNKIKILPLEHTKLVVDKVAHFHGAWWLLLNDKEIPSDFPLNQAKIKDIYAMKTPLGFEAMIRKMFQSSFKHFGNMRIARGDDQVKIDVMLKSVKNMAKAVSSEFLGKNDNSVFRTLLHGDLWNNNILFQLNSDGSPKDVKFIDYQVSNIGHPAVDLCYLLYSCTDRQFRDQHLTQLLRSYFTIFSSYLSPHIPDISFEQFYQEFQDRRAIGLVGGVLVMPNSLSPDQVTISGLNWQSKLEEHRQKLFLSETSHPSVKELRRRVFDMIDEFEELGIFEKYIK
ncbi:uncharacterized protein LOC131887557 [Tigriopus californicus]|uniref:uncharacterized protein LOC131887557 n=1 Tax=Tigriopus californicus TaxID=6832 RepID=UPI0027DA44ED|nr:uncharacterized protein LOC131887557 [Tigriopus californicus]